MKNNYKYCFKVDSFRINFSNSNNYYIDELDSENLRNLYEIEVSSYCELFVCFKTDNDFCNFKLLVPNGFQSFPLSI